MRSRGAASDSLMLHRTSPGRYSGSGSFFLPLRCAGRVYARGEQVPFTISVQITLAVPFGSGVVATRVSATYVNRRRINRTPCVAALGHDAASYHGHLAADRRDIAAYTRVDPQRAQHAVEREQLVPATVTRAGDHGVHAERAARRGEEVLRSDLTGAGMLQAAGAEVGGIERQRNPLGGEQPDPGRQAVARRVFGERQERGHAGHRPGAEVAELAVVAAVAGSRRRAAWPGRRRRRTRARSSRAGAPPAGRGREASRGHQQRHRQHRGQDRRLRPSGLAAATDPGRRASPAAAAACGRPRRRAASARGSPRSSRRSRRPRRAARRGTRRPSPRTCRRSRPRS